MSSGGRGEQCAAQCWLMGEGGSLLATPYQTLSVDGRYIIVFSLSSSKHVAGYPDRRCRGRARGVHGRWPEAGCSMCRSLCKSAVSSWMEWRTRWRAAQRQNILKHEERNSKIQLLFSCHEFPNTYFPRKYREMAKYTPACFPISVVRLHVRTRELLNKFWRNYVVRVNFFLTDK